MERTVIRAHAQNHLKDFLQDADPERGEFIRNLYGQIVQASAQSLYELLQDETVYKMFETLSDDERTELIKSLLSVTVRLPEDLALAVSQFSGAGEVTLLPPKKQHAPARTYVMEQNQQYEKTARVRGLLSRFIDFWR